MDDDKVHVDRASMRKREAEMIRHRLSLLPQIKREIQDYLKLSQTQRQSARLQKALSLLEQLPDGLEILEEIDIGKIITEFGKLEASKSIARVEILAICTDLAVGLENWNVVEPIRKDESDVVDIWAANIIPDTHWLTFQLPARITVLHYGSHYQIAFGLGVSLDDFSNSIIQIELPKSWTDPLIESLQHLDLFQVQGEKGISLNGIYYELYTHSWVGKSFIEFLNPHIAASKSFSDIEEALYRVARAVIDKKGQQSEKDFLSIWKRSIVKAENA